MAIATLRPARESQFRELMDASYKKVYNLAYKLSGDRHDAEDLTQEAFVRAYRGFGEYEGHRPFENWIFRIVTRLFLDLRRARKRRIQAVSLDAPVNVDGADDTLQIQAPDEAPNPEQHLLSQSFSEDMERALATLKPDQRQIVVLADIEQVGYEDIAVMLNIPVGTVRSRLHRAHKRLREALSESPKKVSPFSIAKNWTHAACMMIAPVTSAI
jgi:RNA polymerase sigma-70 factor, ECF subfamily